MKKYVAEFIGTFALVFCGTGAIIVDQQSNGSLSLLGIAFKPHYVSHTRQLNSLRSN